MAPLALQVLTSELRHLGVRQDMLETQIKQMRIDILILQQDRLMAQRPPNLPEFLFKWWEESKPRRKARKMQKAYFLHKLVETFDKNGE